MINTLRLAKRWKEAQSDPERMVEALAEELREEAASKADIRSLEVTLRAEFGTFRAEIEARFDSFKAEIEARFDSFRAEMRAEMASFKNQVLAAQFTMFIALVALILYRTA
jgi:hypothetical protein